MSKDKLPGYEEKIKIFWRFLGKPPGGWPTMILGGYVPSNLGGSIWGHF